MNKKHYINEGLAPYLYMKGCATCERGRTLFISARPTFSFPPGHFTLGWAWDIYPNIESFWKLFWRAEMPRFDIFGLRHPALSPSRGWSSSRQTFEISQLLSPPKNRSMKLERLTMYGPYRKTGTRNGSERPGVVTTRKHEHETRDRKRETRVSERPCVVPTGKQGKR